jgi:hypothetical protein
MCFLIADTLAALRTVRQACKAPSRLALLGWYWWTFNGHAPMSQFAQPRKQKQ